MSKKIIALVLFVAMMLMMVPAANAAAVAVGDHVDYVVGFDSVGKVWFDDYAGEKLTKNGGTIGSAGVTVDVGTSSFLTEYDFKKGGLKEDNANIAGSGASGVNINLSGKLADLNAYYYTQLGAMVPKAKAVKIPYRVHEVTVGSVDASGNADSYNYNDVTYRSIISGVPSSSDMLVNNAGGYLYYLTVLLTDENSSQTFDITVNGEKVTSVTVNWKNTGSSTSSDKDPTLSVVNKLRKQTANYNPVVDNKAGILYFDIAKRNKDDAATINKDAASTTATKPVITDCFDQLTEAMLADICGATPATAVPSTQVFYKLDSSGNYPVKVAGTDAIYTLKNATATEMEAAAKYFPFDKYYIAQNSTPTTDTTPVEKSYAEFMAAYNAYLNGVTSDVAGNDYNTMSVRLQAMDGDGVVYPFNTRISATLTPLGSVGATYSTSELLYGTERYAAVGGTPQFFLDADGCFELNIKGIQSWNTLSGSTIISYSERMYTLALTFSNSSKTLGSITYDIVFRNVDRSKSGITVLDSEVVLEVGETYTIQFVADNKEALEKGVEWKSVNKNIVKVDKAADGKITALALGDTLIYAEDKAGVSHVVRVFVVEDKNATTDPEPTDPGDEPSSDGDLYAVTASSLNVRKGPGTSYAKVGSLKRGAEVVVIEVIKDGVWMQIEAVSGFKAADAYYVSGKYLSLVD